MKKLLVAASLAAIACAPALADADSSAKIFGVQVRVSDANPADGRQPSFGLQDLPVFPANRADVTVESGAQRQDSSATTPAFAGGNNLLLWDGTASAGAVYSGWSFNNQTMTAFGQLQGDGADASSHAYSAKASWDAAPLFDGRLPFWIGPGSTFSITIATTVTASASLGSRVAADGASFSEWAGAMSFVEIGMPGANGAMVVSRQEFNVYAAGGAVSQFQGGPLEVSFTNTSASPISGYMSLGVSAWGGSQVTAVPEPSSMACLAGGLALLLAVKRRRRA